MALSAFERAGFRPPFVVPSQAQPDPDFPTVAFPNPEEPGVIDAALAAARERGADLVVANDPDADRCAVAVPDPGADGGWRMLRGDEVGVLLGAYVIERGVDPGAVFACSIVSSRQLAAVCRAHGVEHTETLTGFKWISRVPGLRYGYEEAIGYCVDPTSVRDKDGISAALLVCDLAAWLKSAGRTLQDELDLIARVTGVYATDQHAVRVVDLTLISDAMARLRAEQPTALAGSARRAGRRPARRFGRRAAHRRAALPPGRRQQGRSSGPVVPSRSSRRTSRSFSRSSRTTCPPPARSRPPASPP